MMLGRNSLHRVTKVEQQSPRISLILAFELQPNVHSSLDYRRMIYGPDVPTQPIEAS